VRARSPAAAAATVRTATARHARSTAGRRPLVGRRRLQAAAVRARSPAAVRTATARRARSAADLAELRPASWLIALIPLLHSILLAMSCGKIDLKPCLLACSSEV